MIFIMKTELQKVSEETMRFMRGKYVLDEVGDGKNELRFQCGGETVLRIFIRENGYDLFVNDELPVTVTHTKDLEIVKQMMLCKKKPNRKPFSKENALLCRVGDRCDLCIHYSNSTFTNDFHKNLAKRIGRLYDHEPNYDRSCPGGYDGGCGKKECTESKGLEGCPDCENFPCGNSGLVSCGIEAKSTSSDDITWAILPYVDGQYGN